MGCPAVTLYMKHTEAQNGHLQRLILKGRSTDEAVVFDEMDYIYNLFKLCLLQHFWREHCIKALQIKTEYVFETI